MGNPQGSLSPALKWMGHMGIEPQPWCYYHHDLTIDLITGLRFFLNFFFTSRNCFIVFVYFLLILISTYMIPVFSYFPCIFTFLPLCFWEMQTDWIWGRLLEAKTMTASNFVPATETDEVVQCLILLSIQYFQGWRFHIPSGQAILVFVWHHHED